MRLFTFSLFIIVVISMLGCSAENPICSTNFCAVGEVFPRSELEDGQAFSEADIDDTVIFATLVGGTRPVEATPQTQDPTQPAQVALEGATQTTIDAIVSNTLSGGNRFEGTVVEITAVADLVDADNEWVTLETNNSDVTFYVNAYGDTLEGTFKTPFVAGESYTLQLYIQEQEPEKAVLGNAIWSFPVDDIVDSTVSNIVSDTLAGNSRFEGKVANITATVNYVSTTNSAMTLENKRYFNSFLGSPFWRHS